MNKAIVDRIPIASEDCIFSRYIDGKQHCLLRLI